jgi:hypothetical protein
MYQILPRTEIPFGGLDRLMTEQQSNLFQLAAESPDPDRQYARVEAVRRSPRLQAP